MSLVTIRSILLASSALLLAACGGSKTEPVPAPEPAAESPPAAETPEADTPTVEEPAHDDHEGAEAGGTPHVHGLAELAVSRDGNKLVGELVAPMANFGLSESDAAFTDVVTAELSGLVEIDGGTCDASPPHPVVNKDGAHTDAVVHFVWTCAQPAAVRTLRFAGFEAFPLFETVNTIYITETDQIAGELTPGARELALK